MRFSMLPRTSHNSCLAVGHSWRHWLLISHTKRWGRWHISIPGDGHLNAGFWTEVCPFPPDSKPVLTTVCIQESTASSATPIPIEIPHAMPISRCHTASLFNRPVPESTPLGPPSPRSGSKRICSSEDPMLVTSQDTGLVRNLPSKRHKPHLQHPAPRERRPLLDPPPLDTPSSTRSDGSPLSELAPWAASSTEMASCPSPSFDEDTSFLLAVQDQVQK